MNKKGSIVDHTFTRYQKFVIAILAILQFTIVLDFMVLSPLGAILLPELNIKPSQFGLVVSAYAFSAGASGLLAAGFADKFDRKTMLLFFYTGFVAGTVFCAVAPNYHFLLIARIITGLFGGVIGSVSFAIITDLFPLQTRGRVMGFVQMAFAASQVLGIPVGLLLANYFGWHSPFWMIAGVAVVVGCIIWLYMQPVAEHLLLKHNANAFQHLWKTVSNSDYVKGFTATILLATGGFMLMPFGSAFMTNNMKISLESLPLLYGITGIFSIIFGPLIGRVSDKVGKYKIFVLGSALGICMVLIYTNLGATPLWIATALNVILFIGISSRMISASALLTAVPEPPDRGAFMSVNAAVQQISGGIASAVAGMIVVQSSSGALLHYNTLGYVVVLSMMVAILLMYFLNNHIQKKQEIKLPDLGTTIGAG